MTRSIDIFNDVDGLTFEHHDVYNLFECLDMTEYAIGSGDLSVVFLSKKSTLTLNISERRKRVSKSHSRLPFSQ